MGKLEKSQYTQIRLSRDAWFVWIVLNGDDLYTLGSYSPPHYLGASSLKLNQGSVTYRSQGKKKIRMSSI